MPDPNEPGGAMTGANGPVCPECGKPVRPDANLCPNCGSPLILMRQPRPTDRADAGPKRKPDDRSAVEDTIVSGPLPPPPAENFPTPPVTRPTGRVCPSCGHENPPARVRCESCGGMLIAATAPVSHPPDLGPQPKPVPWGLILGTVAAALIVVGVVAGVVSVWRAVHDNSTKTPTSPSASPSAKGSTPAAAQLVLVDPTTISPTATSTLPNKPPSTYGVANTLDGDPTTAWNSDGDPGTGDRGVGVQLTYTFTVPVDLRMITVLNGYQKGGQDTGTQDKFTANGRIQVMKVFTDSGKWTWSLLDDRAPQSLTEPFGKTSSVRLKIVSVYPGDAYYDLGLSEISFRAGAQ